MKIAILCKSVDCMLSTTFLLSYFSFAESIVLTTSKCENAMAGDNQLKNTSSLLRLASYYVTRSAVLPESTRVTGFSKRFSFVEFLKIHNIDSEANLTQLAKDINQEDSFLTKVIGQLFTGIVMQYYRDRINDAPPMYLSGLDWLRSDGAIYIHNKPAVYDIKITGTKEASETKSKSYREISKKFDEANSNPKVRNAVELANEKLNINRKTGEKEDFEAYVLADKKRLNILNEVRENELGPLKKAFESTPVPTHPDREYFDVRVQVPLQTQKYEKVLISEATPSRAVTAEIANYSAYLFVLLNDYVQDNYLLDAIKDIARDPRAFYFVYALEFNIVNESHGDVYKNAIKVKQAFIDKSQEWVYRLLAHYAAHTIMETQNTQNIEIKDSQRNDFAKYIFTMLSMGSNKTKLTSFIAPSPESYILPEDIINIILRAQKEKINTRNASLYFQWINKKLDSSLGLK